MTMPACPRAELGLWKQRAGATKTDGHYRLGEAPVGLWEVPEGA
jgi:hypothetical protein